jgi:uncharacterized membrane protein
MNHEEERRRFDRSHDPVRVMALTDGVFAIVITLLVLEIQVPDLTGGQGLTDALDEIRPSFVAFLISFIVVAIAWTGHRDLFAFIRFTDRNLVCSTSCTCSHSRCFRSVLPSFLATIERRLR